MFLSLLGSCMKFFFNKKYSLYEGDVLSIENLIFHCKSNQCDKKIKLKKEKKK